MFLKFAFILCVVLFSPSRAQLSLTLVHLNDIHAHFEEVNAATGRCHADEAEAGNCYGGMSRMYTYIKHLFDTEPNVILLNAGDYYQGTIWYSQFKYEPVAEFANMLNYTAMGLGNHDFDDGIDGLKPFAENITFDLLAANIEEVPDTETTQLGKYLKKSTVIQVDGVKVGIVGYTTVSTTSISSPDDTLKFHDEIESIRNEAQRLQRDENVQIIIALGHAGYDEVDQDIAMQVEEVDIVVGGHSHTFLYPENAPLPSNDIPKGPYPTYITQQCIGDKTVPVVQAYCYTKYIGVLKLDFDEAGNLKTPVRDAQVVLLDNSIDKDPMVEEALQKYRDILAPYYEVVGNSTVDMLKNETHPGTETNIGNAVTDSMVEWFGGQVDFAFINDGGIRSNIVKGNITGEDIYYVLPFNNTVDNCTIYGRDVKQELEYYADGLCYNDPTCYPGSFLQMSGIKVVYDVQDGNELNRVTSIKVRCEADANKWCEMDLDKIYVMALPSFLSEPSSKSHLGYYFNQVILNRTIGPVDYDVFDKYVREKSPLSPQIEDRITVLYPDNVDSSTDKSTTEADVTCTTSPKTTTSTTSTAATHTNGVHVLGLLVAALLAKSSLEGK